MAGLTAADRRSAVPTDHRAALIELGHRAVAPQHCPQTIQLILDPNRPSRSADEVRFMTASRGLCAPIGRILLPPRCHEDQKGLTAFWRSGL